MGKKNPFPKRENLFVMKHLRGEHLNTEEQKRCIIVWLSKTKKANGCRSSDLIKTKT